MTKARDLANLISTGNPLADGALAASEVSGLHAVATSGAASDVTGLATVATSGAYANLTGTPTLSTVATSGAYADVTGTPSLATVATSGAYSDLSGSPSGDSLLPSQSGNTGKFLTSNGSASSWADAGGGAYELISKTSISSNVTSVTYSSITAAEGQLIIIFNNVKVNADGRMEMYFRDASGNNLNTGSHEYNTDTHGHDTGGNHFRTAYSALFRLNATNYEQNESINSQINIYGWGTANPFIYSNTIFHSSGNDVANHQAAAKFLTSGSSPVPTGIVFDPTGEPSSSPGNPSSITTGDIYVYKLV